VLHHLFRKGQQFLDYAKTTKFGNTGIAGDMGAEKTIGHFRQCGGH
jgi:hypothetical protein